MQPIAVWIPAVPSSHLETSVSVADDMEAVHRRPLGHKFVGTSSDKPVQQVWLAFLQTLFAKQSVSRGFVCNEQLEPHV